MSKNSHSHTEAGSRRDGGNPHVRAIWPGLDPMADVHDALGGKHQREGAAGAIAAFDTELRFMAHGHVLGDGQPQPRSAGRARAATVSAVEALCQPGDVLCGNADARVLHRVNRAAVLFTIPTYSD